MTIYIAADHNGFEMKNQLRDWLTESGYAVEDLGPETFDKADDYPDYGIRVAREVAKSPDESLGVLLCGSGVGMAVVADKVKGVRAGLIHDPEIARMARQDDNINTIALGASYISLKDAQAVIAAWLDSSFSGAERHVRRIGKIAQYEQKHSCSCENCK